MPIWRRHGLVYGGDAFAGVRRAGHGQRGDGHARRARRACAIDLTGGPRPSSRHLRRRLHRLHRQRSQPQLVLMSRAVGLVSRRGPRQRAGGRPRGRPRRGPAPGADGRIQPARTASLTGQRRPAGSVRRAERERLKSGFATRVLVRVGPAGGGRPRAGGRGGPAGRDRLRHLGREVPRAHHPTAWAPSGVPSPPPPTRRSGAPPRCWQFPVVDLAPAAPRRATTSWPVRADLNPISEDLLADVRRWLVQPARGQRRLGAGDSFFGSFVSIFVNPRIEDSERRCVSSRSRSCWACARRRRRPQSEVANEAFVCPAASSGRS